MFLVILATIALETYVFWQFSFSLGFLKTTAFYLLPSLLSFFLLPLQSRAILFNFAQKLSRGEEPTLELIKVAMNFIALILFAIPMISTRIFAIFLVLPGFKTMIAHAIRLWAMSKLASGAFKIFTRFENMNTQEPNFDFRSEKTVSPRKLTAKEEIIDVKKI